jgi:nucleotide-binding universal stress UspA family protein
MLHIQRILFPTDFSSVAEDAFSHAAHLAMKYDAEVHVFNVASPHQADQANPMDYLPLEASDEEGGQFFMPIEEVDVETPAHEQGSVRVVYRQVESVSPAKAIIDRAGDLDVDLIVMGTHGRKGVDRLLSTSVSEEVVRQAPCPVFTILGSDDDGPTAGPFVRRVLAPVDLSEQSTLVADHAAELAATYDATLDLLHVVEEAAYPTVYGIDPLGPALPDIQERAREAMEELASRVSDRAPDVEVHVMTGYAARDIIDFAADRQSSLIVMATHGRTGLERFLIGSVAEKVVRSATCPVFTLKSFGKSLLASSGDETGAFDEAAATAGDAEETPATPTEE